MHKLCDAGKILADVLGGLADQHGGDLGDGLRKTRCVPVMSLRFSATFNFRLVSFACFGLFLVGLFFVCFVG